MLTNTKDALGNDIIIGKSYGISQSKNGFTDVKFGEATKISDKGLVTLDVFHHRRALYNDPAKEEKAPYNHITVKPLLLFPL